MKRNGTFSRKPNSSKQILAERMSPGRLGEGSGSSVSRIAVCWRGVDVIRRPAAARRVASALGNAVERHAYNYSTAPLRSPSTPADLTTLTTDISRTASHVNVTLVLIYMSPVPLYVILLLCTFRFGQLLLYQLLNSWNLRKNPIIKILRLWCNM